MGDTVGMMVVSRPMEEEEVAIEVLELASRYRAIEVDLRHAPSAEMCETILDVLEGAFALKRKEITLHVAVNTLSKALVTMVRHSDVITKIIVDGTGDEANALVDKFKDAVFKSTKVRHA